MKTLKLTLAIALFAQIFLITSCNKGNDLNSTKVSDANVNKELVDEFLKLPSIADQRVAYGNLSEYDKSYLWNSHFEKLMGKYELTKDQQNLILDLKNKLQPSAFDKNEKDYANLDATLPDYKTKFIAVLGFPMAKEFLTSFDESSESLAGRPAAAQGVSSSETCTCRVGDDWCISGSCNSGCTNNNGAGCGTLLRYNCNGICH